MNIKQKIVELILKNFQVDAIYLYGSRSRGTERSDSDWDIGILFHEFLPAILDRYSRPQEVEALLQRELKLYDKLSVVDIEIVPPPLQYNIIRGHLLFSAENSRHNRIENSIYSRIEKDYDVNKT